ncbi:hypothetical protein ElyMa_004286900 [Elysia marginata]|uniref:Saposin B-type domain-containing protein n=1 Tax=Elysia marginata TaxID=1093978 RepID=A0AAV4GYM5_9GAST|nr:hypothetical protein ElyMa_004286900 [Elysia marginata]
MKCVLLLAAFIAIASAQWGHNELADLVKHEVKALVSADGSLTVDGCTAMCDDLFDLITAGDEETTDKLCKDACNWYVRDLSCVNCSYLYFFFLLLLPLLFTVSLSSRIILPSPRITVNSIIAINPVTAIASST